mmetsp:Transcript_102802/g.219877  ORF Transcript_102802/g.219877 Transcript_102802/m.219877 type:complete len:156 (-) Transcript_102802:353-820(-)
MPDLRDDNTTLSLQMTSLWPIWHIQLGNQKEGKLSMSKRIHDPRAGSTTLSLQVTNLRPIWHSHFHLLDWHIRLDSRRQGRSSMESKLKLQHTQDVHDNSTIFFLRRTILSPGWYIPLDNRRPGTSKLQVAKKDIHDHRIDSTKLSLPLTISGPS